MFANISHIDEVRPFVDASDGQFYIADKGDYLVANYAAIMTTFPPMQEEAGRVLRECRGLIFCGETGGVIRRPLHKFFNLGEREESRGDNFKPEDVVAVYDKLDGSMVSPFMLHTGVLVFGTKMGLTHMTDDISKYVAKNKKYFDFSRLMNALGYTTIYEYMAPKHRIVVNHAEELMVLLAVRDTGTGEYLPHEKMVQEAGEFNVPVVRRWEVDPSLSLVEQVRELEGAEGVVLELRNGDRLKVKSLWYCDLHKNREAIAREKYVVGLILNERIDDAIGLVPDFVVPRLEAYVKAFMVQYEAKAVEVAHYILKALHAYDQKRDFAIATAPEGNHLARNIAFKVFDERAKNPHELTPDIAAMFKERILAFTDKSDTDFNTQCRKAVFNDNLPAWNIWEDSTPIEE